MPPSSFIARVKAHLGMGEWGFLQFSYARYLDTLAAGGDAVLVDLGAAPPGMRARERGEGTRGQAGDRPVNLLSRVAFDLAGYAQATDLRLYVAADDEDAYGLRERLRGAGREDAVVWLRRRSRRYMRVLASAGVLVGDESSFPFFFVKRRGQRLVCVPDMRRVAQLDRHAIADAAALSHAQQVLLAGDWIACPDLRSMRCLMENTMVGRLYRGTYVLPQELGEDRVDAACAAFRASSEDGGRALDSVLDGAWDAPRLWGEGGEALLEAAVFANGDAEWWWRSFSSRIAALAAAGEALDVIALVAEGLHAGKPLVVLYGDTLKRTGIETSLRNLLASVDAGRADFVLMCSPGACRDGESAASYDGLDFLNALPDSIGWLGFRKGRSMRMDEVLAWMAHTRFRRDGAWVHRKLGKVFERESRRVLGGIRPDALVHFTGYDFEFMQMMRHAHAGRKVLFIHNDMERELASAGNVDAWSLACACAEFDAVCGVQERLEEPLARAVAGRKADDACSGVGGRIASDGGLAVGRYFTVHNVVDAGEIRARAALPPSEGDYEECSCSFAELEALIADGAGPLFVWLGRFVEQKGCDRLLEAFSTLVSRGVEARLVMAGSSGELYEQTRGQAAQFGTDRVAVIRALANPYALLSHASALVLASRYEGWGMVVMEALTLGKPVVCTDMPGVGAFLREGGFGHVVANSTAGIEGGLADFAAGRLGPFERFDVDAFNARALSEFYAALGL